MCENCIFYEVAPGSFKNSVTLSETRGPSSTSAVVTILNFIMHGCISIHQFLQEPNFHRIRGRALTELNISSCEILLLAQFGAMELTEL